MTLDYYPDTDSLYITLDRGPAAYQEVVHDGIVLDFDEKDRLIGIDIDHAANHIGPRVISRATKHGPAAAKVG